MNFVKVERKDDYAVVILDRGKVNALNHAMIREIRAVFDAMKTDAEVRGVIITGKPHYFSAGLDLIELYEYDRAEISAFWVDLMGMMIDLTKFEKPLVGAISGHSPAGGAVIAVTCDHRLMAQGEKYLIGLNEVAVGISITESIFALYSFWLGKRNAYQALLQGKLFTPDEAKGVGLIDETCDLEELLPSAEKKMKELLRANDYILRGAKVMMRKNLIAEIDVDLSDSIARRTDYWMSTESRARIGAFVAQLKGGVTAKK